MTVTFALTTVLCACGPSFAMSGVQNAPSSSAHTGCHGAKASHDDSHSGVPTHEHEKNCQHCNHAQLLETRDAGQAVTAPNLYPVSLLTFAVPSTPAVFAGQWLPRNYAARAAPPPTYLLNRVFLI